MSKNIGNFQDYIKGFNKEIRKAEKFIQEVKESNYNKEYVKDELQIILGTLQIAAYDNEINSIVLSKNDVKEIGLIMFEGKKSDNFKAVRISKPHKKLDNFMNKHRDLFEEYEVFKKKQ